MTRARLRSWFYGLEAWLARAKTTATEPEDVLQVPPAAVVAPLAQAVAQLSVPQPYHETVRSSLAAAIDRWRTDAGAANSLVILGSPVDPLETILQTSLTDWHHGLVTLVQPLPDWRRPEEPQALTAQLSDALDPTGAGISAPPPAAAGDRHTVVMLPALEEFFLRCIGGWAAIEYLQNLVVHHRHRFWVLGCNQWAWTYLDRVCQIGAYLEQVESLPPLSGEELRAWLGPLLEASDQAAEVEVPPGPAVAAEHPFEGDPEGGRDSFWASLSRLAGGTGWVAADLWLGALRIRAEDLESLEAPGDVPGALEPGALEPDQSPPLHLSQPLLPSLPDLTVLDRYLLHSLLIHGALSRQQLALSLGEAENQVRSRVQVLQRAGVIRQQGGRLRVQPSHYPKLRGELSNNNFLIGDR